MGVCGMKFKIEGDSICGFAVEEPESDLLFVTENGRGKRSTFDDFRVTHRGSKGVIGNPIGNEKNGKLIGIATVKGDETMVLLTSSGIMMRTSVGEVRTMGRGAAGVNFIKLKGDATLASFSLAPADAEDETPATAVDGEGTPVAEGVTEAPTAEVAPEATEAPAETPEA
jgi:DNA gyrase subunit A